MMGKENKEQFNPKLNYESFVDSFIPSNVPRIPTDQPLYPDEFLDSYELNRKYLEAYNKKV